MVRAMLLLALGGAFAPRSWAQDLPEPMVDPQNVAAVLDELDSAGTPPTTDEIAEFLASASTPATGYWLARVGWLSGEGWAKTSRLRWSKDGFALRAKWRQGRDGADEYGLAAQFDWAGLRLAAGQLGLVQGYGLLIAGPGRGPSLTADGTLSAGSRGLVAWSGAAEAQTILGGSVGWQSARWQMRVLAGRRAAEILESQGPQRTTVVWQTMATGEQWQVVAVALMDPAEKGLSVAGRWRRGVANGAWEAVWRQPTNSAEPLGAWLGQTGWRPSSVLYFECLLGWADPGPRPLMGKKHPVLAGWSGQGVAVRGTWRPTAGLGLKVLVHGGQAGALGVDRRENQSLVDLQLSRRWPSGWRLDGRWRSGVEAVDVFSERFPWQPAALAWRDTRDVVSLKGTWQSQSKRLSLAWRQLTLARVSQESGWESGGTRSMVAIGSVLGLDSAAKVRLGWSWSWGDSVDLVSAVVPFSGYVLPRHWGHWQAEINVGLEYPWRGLVGKIALSKRTPAAESLVLSSSAAESWAGWWEMVWHW